MEFMDSFSISTEYYMCAATIKFTNEAGTSSYVMFKLQVEANKIKLHYVVYNTVHSYILPRYFMYIYCTIMNNIGCHLLLSAYPKILATEVVNIHICLYIRAKWIVTIWLNQFLIKLITDCELYIGNFGIFNKIAYLWPIHICMRGTAVQCLVNLSGYILLDRY